MSLTTEQIEALARLQERNGNDWQKTAETLFSDNYKARETSRALRKARDAAEEQIQALESKLAERKVQEPDKNLLSAYQALGTPEELTERLGAAQKAIKQQANAGIAALYKWRPEVLNDLLSKDGIEPTIRDVPTAEGKTVQAAVVMVDGKETTLEHYAAERWGLYTPVLAAEAASNGVGYPKQPPPAPSGRQGDAGKAAVQTILTKRYRPQEQTK